jgi:hypothetical protein
VKVILGMIGGGREGAAGCCSATVDVGSIVSVKCSKKYKGLVFNFIPLTLAHELTGSRCQ